MRLQRLIDLRTDRDITQVQIASHLNIAQNTYSQYERGLRDIPLELLMELARFFDTSVDYLVGLTDNKEPYCRSNTAPSENNGIDPDISLPPNNHKPPLELRALYRQ